MATKSRRLLARKSSQLPNKLFIASAYRIEDEWGVRYETVFTQISNFEATTRKKAIDAVADLILAANNAYLDSNGGE